MDELIDRLVATELARFTANDYRGADGAPPFELVEGTIPVLVSAPHAVTHMRGGRTKPSDDYTGAIALRLSELTGAHAMVASHTYDGDPNWDAFEVCAYKQALVTYVREHDIRLVLDLHGMPAATHDAVEVGSADGVTVLAMPGADLVAARTLREELTIYLRRYEKVVSLNGNHAARGENTVARTVARECGICTLQVEINTIFRVPSFEGTHRPAGDRMPFSHAQLPHEVVARSNPDPACVEATIRALATLMQRLVSNDRTRSL